MDALIEWRIPQKDGKYVVLRVYQSTPNEVFFETETSDGVKNRHYVRPERFLKLILNKVPNT